MELEGRFDEDAGVVTVGGNARQRYHDSRGYG
ncbi:tRNA intron endonuclease, partial [Halobiforma nitratireducens JCM 10879]